MSPSEPLFLFSTILLVKQRTKSKTHFPFSHILSSPKCLLTATVVLARNCNIMTKLYFCFLLPTYRYIFRIYCFYLVNKCQAYISINRMSREIKLNFRCGYLKYFKITDLPSARLNPLENNEFNWSSTVITWLTQLA